MLARCLPTATSRAYAKLGIMVPSAAGSRHRLLYRPITAIQLHQLRRLSQRPQDPNKPPSTPAEETAQESSNHKPQSVLDRMGATRTVKIVVIVFFCIYATMETIFYASALYRYLSKKFK